MVWLRFDTLTFAILSQFLMYYGGGDIQLHHLSDVLKVCRPRKGRCLEHLKSIQITLPGTETAAPALKFLHLGHVFHWTPGLAASGSLKLVYLLRARWSQLVLARAGRVRVWRVRFFERKWLSSRSDRQTPRASPRRNRHRKVRCRP